MTLATNLPLAANLLQAARSLPLAAALLALPLQGAMADDSPAGKAPANAQNAAPKDSVLAIVNAEPITRRRVGHEAMLRYGTDIVDGMVDRYLVLQACKEAGIHISNEDVQNEVIRVAGKFGLAPETYLKLLEDERNITPEQYSSEIIWPMLALRALVSDQVTVTQEEFDKAFISQFGESVKCRMIMMSDRGQATQILEQVRANPDQFGQLAAQHSEDAGSASVRGLIPPIRHHMGDPELEKLAFDLEENEISDLFQLGDQWVMLQCVRKLAATPPSEEAFPAIREQITDRLRDEKVRSAASELFRQLREEAKVVRVLGAPELEAKYPGVAAIINNQKLTIAQATEEAIKRHGKEILEGEINRTLLTQALRKNNLQVTAEDVEAEVERAAIAFGFVDPEGKADVAGWFAEALDGADAKAIELYKKDAVWPTAALKKLIGDDITITEEDLQQGFEKNFGPRVEVLAIVLGDQRTAQRVWEMARNNPTEKFFGELAAQYSIEPSSQSNFGKVPPIRRHGGQPAIEEEAFALKPGGLSGIIATGDKYILLRCQGRTEPLVSDPSAVREELVRDIREKKERVAMAQQFDEIKQTAQIDNFLAGTTQDGRIASEPKSPARR